MFGSPPRTGDYYGRLLDEYFENSSSHDRSFAYLYSNALEPPSVFSLLMVLLRNTFHKKLRDLINFIRGTPPIVYASAEEIISQNVLRRAYLPMPDKFLETFVRLRGVPLDNVLLFLDHRDICRMQLAHRQWDIHIRTVRGIFPVRNVHSGDVLLLKNGDVQVYRQRSKININHEQFSKSLLTVAFGALMMQQYGRLNAASFHIPELDCRKLDIRIHDPIAIEDERELDELFEQVITNRTLQFVNLIARAHGDQDEIEDRLKAIVARSPYLLPENANLVVLAPQ